MFSLEPLVPPSFPRHLDPLKPPQNPLTLLDPQTPPSPSLDAPPLVPIVLDLMDLPWICPRSSPDPLEPP